jgi:hypothetical protein
LGENPEKKNQRKQKPFNPILETLNKMFSRGFLATKQRLAHRKVQVPVKQL